MTLEAGYNKRTVVLESLLLISWILFLSLPLSPIYSEPGDDIELFRYVGMLINKGYLPYADVYDNKAPLIYFCNSLTLHFGMWGTWLLSTLLLTVSTFMLSVVLKRKGIILAIVYPMLFVLLLRYSPLIMGGGLTREYSSLFLMMMVTMYYFPSPKFKIITTGFLTAIILLMQPNDVLCALPFVWLLLYSKERNKQDKSMFIASFSIPLIITLTWFINKGILDDMLFRIFQDNSNQYITNGANVFQKITRTVVGLWTNKLLIPLLICGLFLTKQIFENKGRDIRIACLLGIVFSLINASISGRALGHYYLPLIPFLIWALILVFEEQQFSKNAKLIAFSFLGAIWLNIDTLFVYVEEISFRANNSFTHCFERQLTNETLKDNDLLVVRQSGLLSLNTIYKVKSPAQWAIQPDFHLPFSMERKRLVLNELITSAKINTTKWIIDGTAVNKLGAEEFDSTWSKFLLENYSREDSIVLYKQSNYTYLYRLRN